MVYTWYMIDTTKIRYWSKIKKRSRYECWEFSSLNKKGYGELYHTVLKKRILAHRYGYILQNGYIPNGMVIDHTCFNRSCQNPEHLRILTPKENSLRINRKPITHCKRGHEFTTPNTKVHTVTGCRVCVTCNTIYQKEWSRKKRGYYLSHVD